MIRGTRKEKSQEVTTEDRSSCCHLNGRLAPSAVENDETLKVGRR
jgi:hypothetical protein